MSKSTKSERIVKKENDEIEMVHVQDRQGVFISSGLTGKQLRIASNLQNFKENNTFLSPRNGTVIYSICLLYKELVIKSVSE